MAVLLPPVALQNVSTLNSDDFRGLIQGLVPTEGILASADLAVTQNGTPNMTVNCAAGAAVIVGDDTPATQGSYFVKNDATVNLAIAAADPTNPRKDLIILQVRDSFYAGADDDARLFVVTGTPAGSPAEPALPNNSLKLAVVTVAAAATSITTAVIADSRTLAASLGGIPNDQWTAYTPTLEQGSTLAKTVSYARYERLGRMVHVQMLLTVTGSGSAGARIEVGLPFAGVNVNALAGGMFGVFNESGPNYFVGACMFFTTSTVCGFTNNNSALLGQAGAAFGSALAADDIVWVDLTYEAAS